MPEPTKRKPKPVDPKALTKIREGRLDELLAAEAQVKRLEQENRILRGTIDSRIVAAEAQVERYREALERIKEAAKADDRDQAVRLVDEALSPDAEREEPSDG